MEWQNGRMADWQKWQNGRMAEWQNGRMAEWQNGRMAEWRNGRRMVGMVRKVEMVRTAGMADGMVNRMVKWWEWLNGGTDGMVEWR